MKKNTTKINYILGISFIFLLGLSTTNGARIYLDPTYSGFIKNCPGSVNIMIDTEGKDVIASEINIFFDNSLMEIASFEYGNAFKGGGLTQTNSGHARMIGFDINPINGIYTFGKLTIKSIGNTTAGGLGFEDPTGKVISSLAEYKVGKELLTSVRGGYYTFSDGICPFSGSTGTGIENNVQVISKTYADQINTLRKQYMEKIKKEKMTNRIIIISFLLLIILILIYFGYKRLKSYNTQKSGQ